MKREIKFEILYDNKVFGYERLTEHGWEWMILELNPSYGERWSKGTLLDSHKLIRRQFTGLQDKNGKDAYDGDIYKDCNGNTLLLCSNNLGVWADLLPERITWIRDFTPELWKQDCEIIGNPYEHPHLLNQH